MSRKLLAIVALCILSYAGASLPAQTTQPAPALTQKLLEYAKLQQELATLFAKKDFAKAADVCREQMKLIPESAEPHYNLACSLVRTGHNDEAMAELTTAIEHGYTDSAHMREDDDLTPLREQAQFKELLVKARQKELNAPHEKGTDIAGVKMIEGFPEGGLRYRLRIDPAASAKKPARLLVWLHPSGGSMDNIVEKLSPQFAKDGFALVVFTQKNYVGWNGVDVAALMTKTLPDVAKIEGVDAKRPILLGFSAGGQVALQMWQQNPAGFGGLVVDAAYPIDPQKFTQRQLAPLALPNSDAIQKCPIFVVVGGADGGSNLWKFVEKSWREAKVPLTLHILPGRKHEWLFDKNQETALHAWLKRVAAGELPSEASSPAATQPADTVGPSIKI